MLENFEMGESLASDNNKVTGETTKFKITTLVKEIIYKDSINETPLEQQINYFIKESEEEYAEKFKIIDIQYSMCTKNVDAVKAIRGALIRYTLLVEV